MNLDCLPLLPHSATPKKLHEKLAIITRISFLFNFLITLCTFLLAFFSIAEYLALRQKFHNHLRILIQALLQMRDVVFTVFSASWWTWVLHIIWDSKHKERLFI